MVKVKAKAKAKALVEEMQPGMAGTAILGGVELKNKAVKEAVIAERKDLGRL